MSVCLSGVMRVPLFTLRLEAEMKGHNEVTSREPDSRGTGPKAAREDARPTIN